MKKHWFLPEVPDVLGLLRHQAHITLRGLEAFAAWSQGDVSGAQRVRDAEHDADEAKRAVRQALRSAFSTPLDPEDLYELSERTDLVMNSTKNIVREAELIAMAPDQHMAAMADAILAALRHLVDSFGSLATDADRATHESDAAVDAIREVERAYRRAMSDLLETADLREVMGRRELYRRYARAADAIEAVAERVWYAVVKAP